MLTARDPREQWTIAAAEGGLVEVLRLDPPASAARFVLPTTAQALGFDDTGSRVMAAALAPAADGAELLAVRLSLPERGDPARSRMALRIPLADGRVAGIAPDLETLLVGDAGRLVAVRLQPGSDPPVLASIEALEGAPGGPPGRAIFSPDRRHAVLELLSAGSVPPSAPRSVVLADLAARRVDSIDPAGRAGSAWTWSPAGTHLLGFFAEMANESRELEGIEDYRVEVPWLTVSVYDLGARRMVAKRVFEGMPGTCCWRADGLLALHDRIVDTQLQTVEPAAVLPGPRGPAAAMVRPESRVEGSGYRVALTRGGKPIPGSLPFLHPDPIASIEMLADGALLITREATGDAVVWDLSDGRPRRRFERRGNASSPVFSHDGSRVAWLRRRGAYDDYLHLESLVGGARRPDRKLPPVEHGHPRVIALSSDGSRLVEFAHQGWLRISDPDTLETLARRDVGVQYPIGAGFFDADRLVWIVSGQDVPLHVYSARDLTLVASFALPIRQDDPPVVSAARGAVLYAQGFLGLHRCEVGEASPIPLVDQRGAARIFAVAPGEAEIARSDMHGLHLMRAGDGAWVAAGPRPTGLAPVGAIAYSSDGNTLLVVRGHYVQRIPRP